MAISQNDVDLINQMISKKLKDYIPQISQQIFSCMTEDIIDGIDGVFNRMLEDPKTIDKIIDRIQERS